MKMIWMVADAARVATIRTELQELGVQGYSLLPVTEGSGRTGQHTGDRIHPGGLVAFVVVDEDGAAERTFDELTARRDRAGDTVTRLFLLPVERQA
ncbi:MAG: P-II family nitrogen regulator [Hyphomicrobiales bacterium]